MTEMFRTQISLGERNLLLNKRLQSIATLMYNIKNDMAPQTIYSIFRHSQLTHTFDLKNNDFRSYRFNTIHYERNRYFGPH